MKVRFKDEDQVGVNVFFEKNDEFVVRKPGTLNGINFKINKCNQSQLYVHDITNDCSADLCFNCSVVLGPVKGLC